MGDGGEKKMPAGAGGERESQEVESTTRKMASCEIN